MTTQCGVEGSGDKPASGEGPAPQSKAAALRWAKATVEALKKRAANMFVAATRLRADIDVVNGIRINIHANLARDVKYLVIGAGFVWSEHCRRHPSR